MPSAMSGQLRIGLSRAGIALVYQRGWLRRSSHLLDACSLGDEAELSVDQVASRLDQMLGQAACRQLSTRLVLADHWSRHWMVTPPANAVRPADCQAGAAARFQALYGEPLGAWQLAADTHASQTFLAVAVPTALLAALRQVCDRHQLSQREVATQFVVGWNRWRPALQPGAWFAVVHGGAMTLGAVVGGRLRAIRGLALPAQAEAGWLATAVRREALRWLIEPPSLLQSCGDWPVSWSAGVTAEAAGSVDAGWTCRRLDGSGPGADLAKGLIDSRQAAVRLATTGY